jgi:DNA-binding MarR family transcriptional regulator
MADEVAEQCAAEVIGTVNLVLRVATREIRDRPVRELSTQQFRALMIVRHCQGASMSTVLERIGSSAAAASSLIEGLVQWGYVRRETSEGSRMEPILELTDDGERVVASVHLQALSCLEERLSKLSPGECAVVRLALDLLRTALVPARVSTA